MFIFKKLIISIIWNVVIFGGLLFLAAGTFNWLRAWVFLAVVVIATILTMIGVFPGREELLKERFKPPIQKGQPFADKIILLLFVTMFLGLIAFIPLDVFGFHLISKPGKVVSSLGMVFFIAGWWIVSVAMKENAFAVPVVKHQEERRQTVVDTGAYGIVRHPMYAGGILLMVGMPLWLESYAAAILAIVPIGLIALRILVEEGLLKKELTGYEEYTRRVRYRLIPFLW